MYLSHGEEFVKILVFLLNFLQVGHVWCELGIVVLCQRHSHWAWISSLSELVFLITATVVKFVYLIITQFIVLKLDWSIVVSWPSVGNGVSECLNWLAKRVLELYFVHLPVIWLHKGVILLSNLTILHCHISSILVLYFSEIIHLIPLILIFAKTSCFCMFVQVWVSEIVWSKSEPLRTFNNWVVLSI